MTDAFTPLIIQLGLGGIGGFFVGYLLKKVIKFALIIGIFTFLLTYFASADYVQIDFGLLVSRVNELVTPAVNFIYPLVSQIPTVGSLMIGTLIGFTKT
jgi:uncharacterized membrane protein (Fun14 family)